MAYVEKIKVKGKTYYKLAHTIKKNHVITHKTKYIGKTLPSKEKVEQLKKQFMKDLYSPKQKYLSPDELQKIERKKITRQQELKTLSPLEKEKKLQEFIVRFTYDSNKLAGVNITLRQTSLILKDGLIPKDIKSIITVKELENHQKGIMAITKYRGPLTIRFIAKLHAILLAGVDDTIAGKTRDELQRNVKIAGTAYVPPPWNKVQLEFQHFFRWYKAENRKLHPLELAALLHLRLISLQPFVDGNSRLSRLLMNWILWKKEYPAVNIPIEDLEDYYNVLDKYQVEKDEKPFVKYIVKKYFES